MTAPPFASVEDYVDTFGGSTPRTESDLDAVSAEIRRYCGWVIWPAETVDLIVDGPGTTVIQLPTSHLTAVTALSETPRGLNQTPAVIPPGDLEWTLAGQVRHGSGKRWTARGRGIAVTFDHGLDDLPPDLRMFVLNQARRAPLSSSNVQQESVGGRSISYRGEVTAAESALLESFRRY